MATAKARSSRTRAKRPRCRICDRAIHVRPGWSSGAATRRHYWSKHREVMLADRRNG